MAVRFRRWFALFALLLVVLMSAGCTAELRKNRHLARGDQYFAAQRFDLAEIEYLRALQAAPLNPVGVRQLALVYDAEGQMLRAHAFLLKAAELQPDNLQIHLRLSMSYLGLRDLPKARQQAEWVLAKQPGQEDALIVLAESAGGTPDLSPTRQQLETMPRTVKDNAGFHAALATLWLFQQDSTNAETEFKKALELNPRCAEAYLGLGNVYWLREDLSHAEESFQKAVKLSPIRSPKRIRFAEFKLRTGADAEARQILEEMTRQAPDYVPAWTFLARIALASRKYDEANGFLRRALARDPLNYEALTLSGQMELDKGDGARAVAVFSRMATFYSKFPQVQYQLARACLLKGDTAKATASLNQALAISPDFAEAVVLLANIDIRRGDSGRAVTSLTNFLKRQPRSPQAYLLLVNAYLAQKQPDRALAVCSQMETLFPKNPDIPLLKGSLLAGQKRESEARAAFEKCLNVSPEYLPAVEQLINLDLLEKHYSQAMGRAQEQVDKKPNVAEPWLLLAKAHITRARSFLRDENTTNAPSAQDSPDLNNVPGAQNDVSLAESSLLKAIHLNPGLQTSYLMLADLYSASGRKPKALQELNSLLANTNDVMALMQVALIQDSLKNYPAARDAYERLLKASPNFSPALNNLAYLYSEHLGDLEKAYQLAEKARQFLPYAAATADTLGWILYKRGEYLRALGLLEDSASKSPNEPEILFHLGMTHYMLGEEQAALVALQQAVQGPKDFPAKEQARQRLALLSIDVAGATPATVAQLRGLLIEMPRDPIALDRLGSIQERDGAFDQALDTYRTALKYNPQNVQLMLKLARLYSSGPGKDIQQGLTVAKQAHELAPDDAQVSAILGRLVFQTGDFKWAGSLLENSSRALPGDPLISYDLGWAYYSLGRVPEASVAMQITIQAGGSSQEIEPARRFLSYVTAAQDTRHTNITPTQMQHTLAAEPDYVPALMLSAILEQEQGNFSQAAALYDRVLALYPFFTPATRNLALLCFDKLNDENKAYGLAVKAREAFPQDPEVAKTLGILEFRKANYSRAAQLLSEGLRAHAHDAELLYYFGIAQYHLKANSQSKAALQQALALNIRPELATDARRVLSELK